MGKLTDLAERCEQATGPDNSLDGLITLETGVIGPFTTSPDAAWALVPKGEFTCVDGPRKYLNIPTPVPNYWRACIGYAPEHRGWGATPALALCAAALRTRHSTPDTGKDGA